MIFIFFILLIKNLDGEKCTCERITDETTCINLKCNWINDNQCKNPLNSTNDTLQSNTNSQDSSLAIYNFCQTKCNLRQQCTSGCELLVGCSFYNGSSISECNQINLRCAFNGSGCIEKQNCSLYDLKYCNGQNDTNNQACSKNYDNTQCIIKTCQSEQFQMCQVDSCTNIIQESDCIFSKDVYGNCTWIYNHCSVVYCQQDFFIDKYGLANQNGISCNLQACENYAPGDLISCDQYYDYQGYQCENQNIYNCQRKQCANYKEGENCPDYCENYESQCVDIQIIDCELLEEVDCNNQKKDCIFKDTTCKQLQCSDFLINNCSNFNNQCIWNGNQCSLIKQMYCKEYDLSICGQNVQYDGKQCKIENNLCVPIETTTIVQSARCESFFSEQQCYETSFFLSCIWFKNRCLSIQLCKDIPEPSKEQCQLFSKKCGYKENLCANIQSCSNYSKQDCYIGIDGPCSVNQMGKCQKFEQCQEISSSDNSVCQQWNSNCISDGQKCVEKSQACQNYINPNLCNNDNRCHVQNNTCGIKQCKDLDIYECQDNQLILEGRCYYSGNQCLKQTACFQQRYWVNCLYKDGCKWQDEKCQDLKCQDKAQSFFSTQFGWQYCNGAQQFQPQSDEECIIQSDWNEIFINGTCLSCDYIEQRPLVIEGQPLETILVDVYSDIIHLFIFFIFF